LESNIFIKNSVIALVENGRADNCLKASTFRMRVGFIGVVTVIVLPPKKYLRFTSHLVFPEWSKYLNTLRIRHLR